MNQKEKTELYNEYKVAEKEWTDRQADLRNARKRFDKAEKRFYDIKEKVLDL